MSVACADVHVTTREIFGKYRKAENGEEYSDCRFDREKYSERGDFWRYVIFLYTYL